MKISSIISPQYDHYFNLPEVSTLYNPLLDVPLYLQEEGELVEFYKLSNEYFSPEFGIKYLLGLELFPFQMAIVRAILAHKFPMLLLSRGAGKSFLLAIYAIYHSIMFPGSKIILVSASFRQAKIIFSEIHRIYDKSPLLQALSKDQPRVSTDHCHYEIGTSSIKALPLGQGGKIRGERSNVTLVDEFNDIPIEIFNVVIRGFSATESDPWNKSRQMLLEQKNNTKKIASDQDMMISEGNKIILSGTAGFKGGTYYKMFSQYNKILANKVDGSVNNYKDIFKEDDFEEEYKIDYRDFCVVKYAYDELPGRLMDRKTIEHARITMPKFLFDMEYMCFKDDTLIITNNGAKKICNINIGDLVLTHKGRFRKVMEVLKHNYKGTMINYKTWGYNQSCLVTNNHPYWTGDNNWANISGIKDYIKLSNLKELNNKKFIDLRDYVSDFIERDNKIFPKASQTILNNNQVEEILSSNENKKILANRYNVCLGTIYQIKNKKNYIPKTAIPYNLKLDFNLGLIVGYYAAEGSVGSHGKTTVFSLDGHVNFSLELYVNQLSSAISNVLGIEPKRYKRENLINITINQRLFAEFIKKICPGLSTNKMIDPDILFSNEEFMKGVITGYWNGDGHTSLYSSVTKASSASINLACQIKLLLSYFGIASGLNFVQTKQDMLVLGKKCAIHDQYSIDMQGENASKFRKVFYGQEIKYINTKKCYYNDKDSSLFLLKDKEELLYDGMVYNLEVEEDHSYSLFNATVHNCKFADDTNGFFKMKDIESATAPFNGFNVIIKGNEGKKYIIGVDPARTIDRFAICVIEMGTPNKVVYAWTCQNKPYSFAAEKIRKLTRAFDTKGIAIDQGGGGLAIEELLNKSDVMHGGDKKLYRFDDETFESNNGLKILHMFNFNSNWIDDANVLLQKNLEDRVIMFPYPQIRDFSDEEDDAQYEISQMKQELVSIEVTHTRTGKKHYDLAPPNISKDSSGTIKHKDRYSALLLANYLASRSNVITNDNKQEIKEMYRKSSMLGNWVENI